MREERPRKFFKQAGYVVFNVLSYVVNFLRNVVFNFSVGYVVWLVG